jgi:hypothetical protein
MGAIAEIFRQFGPEYLEKYSQIMPKNHRKVIDAIIRCRTEECGTNIFSCTECLRSVAVFCSCGNRHCPTCQHHKTRQWLEKQLNRQLPGPHFMVTFTVPEQLRHFIRSRQRVSYSALFAASSAALKELSGDKKFIGEGTPGFFGVLHTWGRKLDFHPHIHYIIPGGVFNRESSFWHPSRNNFYLPVRALSKIFKAKFKAEMISSGLYNQINPSVWNLGWNVNSQAVGSSEGSLKYLAPYVFKVAISDSRIVRVENRQIIFRCKKPKSSRWRTISLEAMEFIRRYLQHVLPKGFMKIRYYGFLGSGSSATLDDIRAAIERSLEYFIKDQSEKKEKKQYAYCPHCKGKLVFCRKLSVCETWNSG